MSTDSSPLCAATQPTGWTVHQPAACFVIGTAITIASGVTVAASGSRPLVLVATASITIAGTLDVASHQGGTAGPGANVGCGTSGTAPTGSSMGGGGGAGGSFMSAGGNVARTAAWGHGGHVAGRGRVLRRRRPRGGCDGERGGNGGATDLAGTVGHGGGVVYLLAQGIRSI